MLFATREGNLNQLNFQVANIHKGLGSVSQFVDAGLEVTFRKEGAYLKHQNGEKTWFRKQGGLWFLDMWKIPHGSRQAVLSAVKAPKTPFTRRG